MAPARREHNPRLQESHGMPVNPPWPSCRWPGCCFSANASREHRRDLPKIGALHWTELRLLYPGPLPLPSRARSSPPEHAGILQNGLALTHWVPA
jgi:hypothetical protein